LEFERCGFDKSGESGRRTKLQDDFKSQQIFKLEWKKKNANGIVVKIKIRIDGTVEGGAVRTLLPRLEQWAGRGFDFKRAEFSARKRFFSVSRRMKKIALKIRNRIYARRKLGDCANRV